MAISGRCVLVVALGAVAAVLAPRAATVLAWAVLVALAVCLDLALAAAPAALALTRTPTPPVRLGEGAGAELVVTHTGRRRLRGVLRDAWAPSAGAGARRHALDLAPGQSARLVTALRPTRRGDRVVERVAVRCWGPLGLAARQASLPAPGLVRVLPPFTSRRHLPAALERLRALDGSASVQLRGAGTEFDALREYVAGDDVRSLDWRATARRGALVVRTWRPERDRHVLVVLDTSRTSAGRVGDAPRLDAAMDAALLVAALASAAGDRVELVAVDRVVRASVRGARGPALMPAVVGALASLEPALVEADWGLVAAQVRRRMPHRGLLVLLTPLEAAATEEALAPALPGLLAAHAVLVGSVADPAVEEMAARRGSAADVHTAAAAQRSLTERAALITLLARAGARVVDADPEHLPQRLADAYLALKAAGAL